MQKTTTDVALIMGGLIPPFAFSVSNPYSLMSYPSFNYTDRLYYPNDPGLVCYSSAIQ